MKHKVIRAGLHSLAVIIPSQFIQALGIKKGDTADVTVFRHKGEVRIKFKGNLQLLLPEGK
ncbi:MAG: hypothetical protein UV73_C0012G0140 [Candidatus Gottesmanbacteria bacterium GW2011_GWA2_43_14]|uniref:SpoVT-AbrB domain-containing protein n=1 Tax=Candidatus Gottesmanbacteria bacterium GW2011_GWA2_43_14 TaxID=1618443 RepID=A0A0G1DEU8_9BACT|nr:MAG: hypothetical protein UV73_C0012G0140 [Candidatus Gottesmanbacteria bacterium GW2011_GWA2_43_14]